MDATTINEMSSLVLLKEKTTMSCI
jgi:hypothetical protein